MIRYIDNPEKHFRFVGFADVLYPKAVRHTGWYSRHEDYDATYRGAVYRLPHNVFVPGYVDSESGGFAFDPSDIGTDSEDADAAITADRLAEREAEKAREYDEAFSAGYMVSQYETAAEELGRELCEFLTSSRPRVGLSKGARVAIREKVGGMVKNIRHLREQASELVDMWGGSSLAESFNEGRQG
jgi:hypothetical protein